MGYFVIPVKTGTQSFQYLGRFWIPACAGMTTSYEFIKAKRSRFFEEKTAMRKISIGLLLSLMGCVGIPDNVKPVDNFKLEKYLGKWYEIARLDHSFERGLTRISADYSLRDDGGVRVLNRGYSAKDNSWKEAEGKAYFVKGSDQGYLKVSFFGPFYGSYIVFELDHENYQYSLVCGPDKSYLWILAREPKIRGDIKDRLIAKAAASGFDTSKLIFVDHGE
jgi:apolipoprotein D and lipocalin family protein